MAKDLFRRQVAQFRPYVPGKPIEEVRREYGLEEIEKLASNENQLGPSPKAIEAVQKAALEMNLYPEATAIDLKRALAAKLGVKEENLVIGNGGEELLQIIAQVFINDGDQIITGYPSFNIYVTTCSLMGAEVISVPFKDGNYDLEAMLAAVTDKTKLIYLCNPNNPTATFIDRPTLDSFLARVPEDVVVVLDEAYYEFARVNPDYPAESIARLVARPNTVILRTFSKVCGIAGVRVGYVISSEEIAGNMNKIKLTFDVNRLAQAAALAALDDEAHIERTVAQNYRSLQAMQACFDELGLHYYPSAANFIWVELPRHSKEVFEAMLRQGVIVRPGYLWGWENWMRVSTGTDAQTARFTEVLKDVLK